MTNPTKDELKMDIKLKPSFEALAKAALERTGTTGDRLANFVRGTAFYDTERDNLFTSLSEFTEAELAIREQPSFQERFGIANSRRVTLQFIYDLLGRLSEPVFEAHFDAPAVAVTL